MEWSVIISGDRSDLEELDKYFNSPQLCITRQGNDYVLRSADFNSLTDANEVKNKACEITPLINGAARLVLEMKKPLAVDCVVQEADNGKRNVFIFPTAAASGFSAGRPIIGADGVVQEESQLEPISSWVAAGRRDPDVAKALRLYSVGLHDWVSLYRIFEVVEKDVGGIPNISKKGWASEKTIERFKRTANSPDATGDESRHGKQRSKTPKDPMTLSEAKSLVEAIVHKWIRLKGES